MVTKDQAEAAVAIAAEYLRERQAAWAAMPREPWEGDDPPHHDAARDWCDLLLTAADVDGRGGCRFCCG